MCAIHNGQFNSLMLLAKGVAGGNFTIYEVIKG